MAISITLQEYMDNTGMDYDVLEHPHSNTTMQSAELAHIPGERLVKSVILEDEDGYLMAVIPSTHYVELGKLHRQLNRLVGLATENELGQLFRDCELGAVPPVGEAFGIDVIIDDSLQDCPDVYFEAGDHLHLIHISGNDFKKLTPHAEHGSFARHM